MGVDYWNSKWPLLSTGLQSLGDCNSKTRPCGVCSMGLHVRCGAMRLKHAPSCNQRSLSDSRPCSRTPPGVPYVCTNPGNRCGYWTLRSATTDQPRLVLPYLSSARPFPFPYPQFWIVQRGCEMEPAGKSHSARWRASSQILFSSRVGRRFWLFELLGLWRSSHYDSLVDKWYEP